MKSELKRIATMKGEPNPFQVEAERLVRSSEQSDVDAVRSAFNLRWKRNVPVDVKPWDEGALRDKRNEFEAGFLAGLATIPQEPKPSGE